MIPEMFGERVRNPIATVNSLWRSESLDDDDAIVDSQRHQPMILNEIPTGPIKEQIKSSHCSARNEYPKSKRRPTRDGSRR